MALTKARLPKPDFPVHGIFRAFALVISVHATGGIINGVLHASVQDVVFLCNLLANPPPLTAFKNDPNPNLSKICPDDCFSGFQIRGDPHLSKISRKFKNDNFRKNFKFSTSFSQIWVPLIGTPENNRRDKCLTNLGFGAFWNAVRGQRVRNILRFLHFFVRFCAYCSWKKQNPRDFLFTFAFVIQQRDFYWLVLVSVRMVILQIAAKQTLQGLKVCVFGIPSISNRICFGMAFLVGISAPKKTVTPPPVKFPADTLPAPRPPSPLLGDPPPLGFSIQKPTPPPSPCRLDSPSPSPSRKNKIYPNVHQAFQQFPAVCSRFLQLKQWKRRTRSAGNCFRPFVLISPYQ